MEHHLKAITILRVFAIVLTMVGLVLSAWTGTSTRIRPLRSKDVMSIHQKEPWTAKWIGLPDEAFGFDRPNSWFCFRKDFTLDNAPEKSTIRIAVDTKYWLYINGELIVREGGLKQAPYPGTSYFDQIEIDGKFAAGKNTIAVLVWHFGRSGFSHFDSGEPGLLLQAEVAGKTIITDASWQARKHPAYSKADRQPNFRLPDASVRFDSRKDITGWELPESTVNGWKEPHVFGDPPTSPWGPLIERPIPQWKDSELLDFEEHESIPSEGSLGPIRTKLPHNAQFYPYLEVEADGARLITVDGDTAIAQQGVSAQYVTRAGRQSFEFPGWMNGHEVIWQIPPGVKIISLKYRETGYGADFSGRFESDDEFLNGLWKKSQRTLYVTMRDTYMDCPDRERAQWWGDAAIELGMAFYALSPESRHLARKGIYELINWQETSGVLHSPIPADGWGRELPTQMLHSIGLKGFWTYYWNTGDRKTLGEVYFGTLKYLDLWELDERGLTVPRDGEWRWIDWGDKKDELALYSAWHALALLGVEEMAELFGDEKRAAQCRADYERIKAAFQKEYWKGTWFKSEFVEEPDDRANGLAVVAGLADPEHFPGILSVLNSVQNSSPYMERYVLDALFMMGEHEAAYDRMKDRYGPLVDNDLTSLPEFWVPEHGSVNHAWSGGPLTLIGEYICGITAIEAGWTRFQVNPSPGSINRFDTVVPSIAGEISVQLEKGELTVEVPNGTSAEVWASSTLSDGAVELRKEKARTVFECGPGVWRFQL